MVRFKEIKDSFLHLLFPHVCAGCGNDMLSKGTRICLRCVEAMPATLFELHENNPVEKKLSGRLPFIAATAQYYFTRESIMQQFIHEFKYKGNKELGLQLGRLMGDALKRSGRIMPDALVPLPLFPDKMRRRGFNQSEILCDGIAKQLMVPVLNNIITRPMHTESQTHKGRIERWKNMEGKFQVADPVSIRGKHLLLVDDVITTGATLESCGMELLKAGNVELSVACLCFAMS